MEEKIKKRNITIDILKGIAVLSVLLGHAIQRGLGINGGDYFGNIVFKIIYTYHMPLFMVLSGYSLAKFTKKYDWKFFWKRVKRLLFPTIIWSYLIWSMRNFEFVGIKEFILFPDTFMDYTKTLLLNPNFIIWFLYVVFIFDIWFIIQKKINKSSEIYFDLLLSILFYLILNLIPTSYFGVNVLKTYFPIFAFGYYLNDKCLKKTPYYYLIGDLIIYLIFLFMFADTFLTNIPVYYIISFTAIVLIYQCVIRIKTKKIQDLFSFFGRYSLEIYLCQCLCLNIGIGSGNFRVLTIFITATTISTILSILTNKIWILRLLLYGKIK